MKERIVIIEGLSGGYSNLPIFRDLHFGVPTGHVLGICGPNGAGKTTLLKTLAGLLPPLAGQIIFQDRPLGKTSAYQRARSGIVLVPEGRQIFTTLTVRQNLELSRASPRVKSPLYSSQLEQVLYLFPRLRERLDHSGGALSGGEQQMLAVGRALLLDPILLMLDEPTQGLAPIVTRQVLTALQGLRGRISTIVVEQNRAFLEALTDSISEMRGGQLT
jgi:ABC-type branched-subunit amino acid transport system ATPase component